MKALFRVALLPVDGVGLVTTTLTGPAGLAGVVAVIVVVVTPVTVAATPPNVTVTPGWKFFPAIVTAVPPRVEPLFSVTDVMVGGAM